MDDIKAQLQATEKVLELSRELVSTLALEPLLHKIVDVATELIDCESTALLLLSDDGSELRFVTASFIADQLADIAVPIDASIAGAAFRSGDPVIVSDTDADPRYFRGVERATGFGAKSLLAVPLQFKNRCIGVLEAQNKSGGAGFTDFDAEMLITLAAYATVAIENARMVKVLWTTRDRLERRAVEHERLLLSEHEYRYRTTALREAGAALGSTLNYEKVLDLILAQMSLVVSYDAANVMLVEDDVARMYRGHGYGQYGDGLSEGEVILDLAEAPILSEMRYTLSSVVIADVTQDPRWIYAGPDHRWIRSYVGVPLRTAAGVIGFLNVNSATPRFFSQNDVDWLSAFADHVSIAIQNARLYSQAQQEIEKRRVAERELQMHRDQLEEMVSTRTSELRQTNEQLQKEIEERIRIEETLRRYAEQLEISHEELDAFTHTVAHDLKGPLSIITGYVGVALADELGQDLPRALQAISRSSEKMYRIIEELLLLADVRRRHEILIEPLDMAAIVTEAIHRLDHMIAQYQAEITLPEVWPVALGYAPWIEEVWANYFTNALKYGGRPPRIELGATVEQDTRVRFWIRDNGAGLTPEEQLRMFTPFTRLAPEKAKGHGLGLSIVHRIVHRLGGDAIVESQLGQGSTFGFILPAAP
jgi:signal transduction histidine kinase